MEEEDIVWDVLKPFDLFLNATDSIGWCTIQDYFRTFISNSFMTERIGSMLGKVGLIQASFEEQIEP